MPNHIRNVIELHGDKNKIKKVFNFVKTKEDLDISENNYTFDFNKFIPMPQTIENTNSSGYADEALAYYAAKTKNKIIKNLISQQHYDDINKIITNFENRFKDTKSRENALAEGESLYTNILLYGAKDWYEWSIKNWDTKWNAYECTFDEDKNVINFLTAWSAPFAIAKKLGEKFPDIEFTWSYADENIGANTGVIHIHGDHFKIVELDNQTSKAYAMYVKCWGDTPCIYVNENGDYMLKDYNTCTSCDK